MVLVAVFLGAVLPAAGETLQGVRGPLSAEEVRALVDASPAEADFPGEDALVLFDGTYLEYADGRTTVRRQRIVKVFTEWAIDQIGDPRLGFDGSRQELEVHASRTYLPNASTVDTPDNGYNEVTPRSVALSRDHLDIREMVVSHVGLERGVSILLDYSIKDTSPHDFPLNRVFFVLDEFPVLEKVIVLEGEVMGEMVNPAGGLFTCPQPEREGDKLVWHMDDLPARPRHAHHRLGDQVPWLAVASARVGLSSMQGWPTLLAEIGARVDQAAAETGDLDTVLEGLEEDTPFMSDRDGLERMAGMVKDRTALLRYRPWVFTPLPRSVAECIETSTATPVERSALVLACSRARGLEAHLILPALWEALSRDVPALEALGDPLVRVEDSDGRWWWIDPGSGSVTALAPLTGGITYFVIDPEGARPEVREEVPNDIRLSIFWDLDEGEARVEGAVTGPIAGTIGWKEPEKLIRGWAEGWSDSAEVTDLTILASGPGGVAFIVNLKAPLPEADDRGWTVVDLPLSPVEIGALLPEGMDLAHSETDGMLFPMAPVNVYLDWKLRPPEGLTLVPGPSLEMIWEDASLAVRRSEEASMIETVYELNWGGRPVVPEEYAGYRNLLLEATDSRLTRVVFGEGEEED
jgi:hypothetical protein